MAFALTAHAASGDNAVPGVKVTVGGSTQTAAFAANTDQLTLTFDVSADPAVLNAGSGQGWTLPVTAVVDPALLADACGCTANTLTQQAAYKAPAPVPTMGEVGLVGLAGLLLILAFRKGAGRQGLKVLAIMGLGVALMQPAHDLRAASGNALESMMVSVNGGARTVTVTVLRSAQCKVNLLPTIPAYAGKVIFQMPASPGSAVLPAANDPENDPLTYSMTGLPSGWTFDAATRVLSWQGNYLCIEPTEAAMFGITGVATVGYPYTVTDQCNRTVTQQAYCAWNIVIP